MRTRARTRTRSPCGPDVPIEVRRDDPSAMHIFESGPLRWALEPKEALILGSVTLNDPDHLGAGGQKG